LWHTYGVKEPKRKTPQEKKALSYERDRHTFAWHSDKGLRKARPKRKATANQEFRRRADGAGKGLLKTGEPANEESSVTNALVAFGMTKKRLRKIDSVPLSQAIAVKQWHRQIREGRKVRVTQREVEEAKSALAFISNMNKKDTLAFVDAITPIRLDSAGRRDLQQRSPALFNAVEWFGNCGLWRARRVLRSEKEWLDRIDNCTKKINRIIQERERIKRRGPA
jgi:hypothetical protein